MSSSKSIGTMFAEIAIRDNLSKGLAKASKSIGNFASSASAQIAGIAGIGSAGALMWKSVGAASDLAETLSKSQVVFGNSSSEIEKWGGTASRAFGQSRQQAIEAAASFGNMFQMIGMSQTTAAGMSKVMTELASDLASFNNTTPEDAITAIGAALRGESEPIRRYGVLLDDATLKAKAFSMGIYKGTGNLTPSGKALAAYNVILEQTKTAQGDYVRTADGLANTQRTINALWKDAQATMGQELLPVVQDIATSMKEMDWSGIAAGIGGVAVQIRGLASAAKTASEWATKMTPPLWLYAKAMEKKGFQAAMAKGDGTKLSDFGKITKKDENEYKLEITPGEMKGMFPTAPELKEWIGVDTEIPEFLRRYPEGEAGPDYLMDRSFADKKPAFDEFREAEKDSFITRGLQLGGLPTSNTTLEKKQVEILQEIRNELKSKRPSNEKTF